MQRKRRLSYLNKLKKIQKWWRNIFNHRQKYYHYTVVLSKIILFAKLLRKIFFIEFKNNVNRKNNFVNKTQKSFYSKKTYKKKINHLILNELEINNNSLIDNSKIKMVRPIFTEYPSTTKYHRKINLNKKTKNNSYLKTNPNIISKNKLLTYKTRSSLNTNKKIYYSRNNFISAVSNHTAESYLERGANYSNDLNFSSNNTYINSYIKNPTIGNMTINEYSKNIHSRNNIKTDFTHLKTYSNFEKAKNYPPRLKININSVNYSKHSPNGIMKSKTKINDNKKKIFFAFRKWKNIMEKFRIINLLKIFLIRRNCQKKMTQRTRPRITCIKDQYILDKLKNITIKMSISAILKGLIILKNAMFFYKKYIYFNKYKDNINREIIFQKLKQNLINTNKHKNKNKSDFISNININNFINYNDYSRLPTINKNNVTIKALLAQKTGDFYMSSNNNKTSNIIKIKPNINLIMQTNQLKMIFNILETQRNRGLKKSILKYYFNLWKKKKILYRKINNNLVYRKKKLSISTNFGNFDNETFKNYSTKHNPYSFYLNNVNNRLNTSNKNLSRKKITHLSRNTNLTESNNVYLRDYPISKTQGSIEEKEVIFPSTIMLDQ